MRERVPNSEFPKISEFGSPPSAPQRDHRGDGTRVDEGRDVGLALLEKPADRQSPKRIDCYVVEAETDGKKCKLDSARVLFSLRYQHNATPPDFELLLFGDARERLDTVTTTLFGELNRHSPHLFEKLRGAD